MHTYPFMCFVDYESISIWPLSMIIELVRTNTPALVVPTNSQQLFCLSQQNLQIPEVNTIIRILIGKHS